jgi:NADH dehydrogenase FAD-containing subunit
MTRSRTARNGVLILGGGFAGAYVARLLGRRGATIVSPENFMLYTPMLLPEACGGQKSGPTCKSAHFSGTRTEF